MPCNSGVSLIPQVDGQTERFAVRGLYNGLALLADATTNSYWDHITGTCVHGALKGAQLAFTPFDLRYTTVAGALQIAPHAQIAFSPGMTLRGRFLKFVTPIMHRVLGNRLPPQFVRTLGEEDTRRERMDVGLGLWTARTRRFYPLSTLRAAPNGVLDQVDGETVFVYYDRDAHAPDAIYVAATAFSARDDAQGSSYAFDSGVTLRSGTLYAADGQPIPTRRPQTMFTRWYGFAFTFPGCEIYD
jgi:hypothetical protein